MSLPTILAAAETSRFQQIWNFFSEGGFCMILLGVCSLVAVAAILFKLLSLRRETIVPASLARKVEGFEAHGRTLELEATLREFGEGRSTLARLCAVAWRRRGETRAEITEAVQAAARGEILHLHAGMAVIDVTISLAPLLGLLGMASGLVVMFGGLGENPDPTTVSRGISEALNTTVFGLALAVPAIVAHAFFLRRIEMFVARLEALLADFARHCERSPEPTTTPTVPKP